MRFLWHITERGFAVRIRGVRAQPVKPARYLAPPAGEVPTILALARTRNVVRVPNVQRFLVIFAVLGMLANRLHAVQLTVAHHDIRVVAVVFRRNDPFENVVTGRYSILGAERSLKRRTVF